MAEPVEILIYEVCFVNVLNALDCSYTIGLIFKRGRVLVASLGVSRSGWSSVCVKIRPRVLNNGT